MQRMDGHTQSWQCTREPDMDAEINDNNPTVFLLKNDSITATFEGNLSVSVSQYSGMLSAVSSLPTEFLGKTKGLLGTWNNDQSDDFMRPNGTTIPSDSSEQDIYHYGLLWEAKLNNLFTNNKIFERSVFIPIFYKDLIAQNSTQYKELQTLCGNNTECIFDAMSTNQTNLGLATLRVSETLQEVNETLNAEPPHIFGNITILTFMDTGITVNYTSNGTGVTFSGDPTTNGDISLSSTGSLTWKPTSTAGFTFNLVATDSKRLSSALQLNFVVCNCNLPAQCNYTMATKINNSSLAIAGCICTNNYTGEFCQNPPNPCIQGCYPNVTCDNTTGCGPCPSGFSGDGIHCTDVDECSTGNYKCDKNADCTNTIGNYTCTCREGFNGNGIVCCSACESDYCSNRGTCTRILPYCNPVCQCVDAYTGEQCKEAKDRYPAQVKPGVGKRSVNVNFTHSKEFNEEECYNKIKEVLIDAPIDVDDVFDDKSNNITNVTHGDNGNWTAIFTARFTYTANITVITFLNDKLVTYILNKGQRSTRSTELTIVNVTDGDKLNVSELFSCLPEFVLDPINLQCDYKCYSYCKNDGTCILNEGNATCICKPFTIYVTSGERCENLAMNLNAFFGILFGALAFLFLLILGIVLGIYIYRKKKSKNDHDDTDQLFQTRFSWKSSLFPSFQRMGDKDNSSLNTDTSPDLIDWKPQLDKVNSTAEVKIKRPEIKPNLNLYD